MLTFIPAAVSTNAIGRSNARAKRATRYATAVATGLVLFATLASVGSAPASAQSLSHYGSPLPRYYNAEGTQIWGSWAPPATDQKRDLYLDVTPNRRRTKPLHKIR